MIRSDGAHWGSLAKAFHWTIVLLLLVQATIGLVMVDLPKKPAVIPVFSFHKSLGLTILALALLRLAWRAFDPRPTKPAGMPRWQVFAARAGHALLYVLLFLVPLSGWWYDSVSALRPLYWFGLVQVPPLGGPDPAIPDLKGIARDWHELLFWALAFVAAGHAAMAVIHQFIKHDGVLARMWPAALQRRPKTVSSPETAHVLPQPTSAPPAGVDAGLRDGDRA
jgi:cytochrome b561